MESAAKIFDNPPTIEFKEELSVKSFSKPKNDYLVNIGYLEEMLKMKNTKNGKFYLVKLIKKRLLKLNSNDNINLKDLLNKIYNSSNNKSLEFVSHWEDNNYLFLVFNYIEDFVKLEDFITNKNKTDLEILNLYQQIVECVIKLHENKLFGCVLHLSSFIYDKKESRIRLTDIGFSHMLPKKLSVYPLKLKNNFRYSYYEPGDYLTVKDGNIDADFKMDEKFDIWQLGILFFKLASNNQTPFSLDEITDEEVKKAITKGKINYSLLNDRNESIIKIIKNMLIPVSSKRQNLSTILNLIRESRGILSAKETSNNEFSSAGTNIITPNLNEHADKSKEKNKIHLPSQINIDTVSDNSKKSDTVINSIYDIRNIYSNALEEKEKSEQAIDGLKKMCQEVKGIIAKHDNEKDYINDNVKLFFELLFKNESINSYENINEKENETIPYYKEVISHFIFEFRRLKMELDNKKLDNDRLKSKVSTMDSNFNDTKDDLQKKIEILQSRIQILESIIFSNSTNNIASNKIFLDTLSNFITSFNENNLKLCQQSEKIESVISNEITKFLNEKGKNTENIILANESLFKEITNSIGQFNHDNNEIKSGIDDSKTEDELKEVQDKSEYVKNTFNKIKYLIDDFKNLENKTSQLLHNKANMNK